MAESTTVTSRHAASYIYQYTKNGMFLHINFNMGGGGGGK